MLNLPVIVMLMNILYWNNNTFQAITHCMERKCVIVGNYVKDVYFLQFKDLVPRPDTDYILTLSDNHSFLCSFCIVNKVHILP